MLVEPEPDLKQNRVYWHLQIEGDPSTETVGWPLNSTLAETIGYVIAHEEWPTWIDDLAKEIEGFFGV